MVLLQAPDHGGQRIIRVNQAFPLVDVGTQRWIANPPRSRRFAVRIGGRDRWFSLMARAAGLTGCGKRLACGYSGARALPASPESKNTDMRNQWLGQCPWVPGLAPRDIPERQRNFSAPC